MHGETVYFVTVADQRVAHRAKIGVVHRRDRTKQHDLRPERTRHRLDGVADLIVLVNVELRRQVADVVLETQVHLVADLPDVCHVRKLLGRVGDFRQERLHPVADRDLGRIRPGHDQTPPRLDSDDEGMAASRSGLELGQLSAQAPHAGILSQHGLQEPNALAPGHHFHAVGGRIAVPMDPIQPRGVGPERATAFSHH